MHSSPRRAMSSSGNYSGEVQASDYSFLHKLSSQTSIFSLKLYVVLGILILCSVVVFSVIFLFICLNKKSRKRKMRVKPSSRLIPIVSKEILEIKALDRDASSGKAEVKTRNADLKGSKVEAGIEGRKRSGESDVSGGSRSDVSVEPENIGWGRWYSLNELEIATRGFAVENVIGEGGYGIVYRGVLQDGSVVAVKNLLNNKGQAGKEFKVEVEAIGKVRHKNLVGLIGYCAEGAQRMLVYEYIDNGNLEQWLHGDVGTVSPLTWDIRMRIAIGTAKGCDVPLSYKI